MIADRRIGDLVVAGGGRGGCLGRLESGSRRMVGRRSLEAGRCLSAAGGLAWLRNGRVR